MAKRGTNLKINEVKAKNNVYIHNKYYIAGNPVKISDYYNVQLIVYGEIEGVKAVIEFSIKHGLVEYDFARIVADSLCTYEAINYLEDLKKLDFSEVIKNLK